MSNWSLQAAFREYRTTLIAVQNEQHCGSMVCHQPHGTKGVSMAGLWIGRCVGTPLLLAPEPIQPASYDAWCASLDGNTRWALCGSRTPHGPHSHTVSFTGETPFPVRCGGVPEFRGTHQERFLELLTEWGITPCTDDNQVRQEPNVINLLASYGNVDGYAGFCADFEFNEDGSFKTVGVWE